MGSRRLLLLVGVTAFAMGLLPFATTASIAKPTRPKHSPRHGRFAGIVPPVNGGPSQAARQGSGNLTYHNDPVTRPNTTHAIHWLPSRHAFNGNNAAAVVTINQHFTD